MLTLCTFKNPTSINEGLSVNKGHISNFLRSIGLLYYSDWARYYLQKCTNRKANREFAIQNPKVPLPPDYLIYESFQLNYYKYYMEGLETAKWLTTHLSKHIALNNKRILDWGCGPGRIVRHLPQVIGDGCEYFGTDYNQKSVDWCSRNLPRIRFNANTLSPRLPYENDFMDVIYGISIFTHLSEEMHEQWFRELYRILKTNGIMFLTTQGDNFKVKLTAAELVLYNQGELVVRGNVREGHRTFSAFHPIEFMKKLFGNTLILEHIVTKPLSNAGLPQDVWIVKKGGGGGPNDTLQG